MIQLQKELVFIGLTARTDRGLPFVFRSSGFEQSVSLRLEEGYCAGPDVGVQTFVRRNFEGECWHPQLKVVTSNRHRLMQMVSFARQKITTGVC